MNPCLARTWAAISIIKALISRGLFVLHGLICIWRVTVVKRQPVYWSLGATIPLLAVESVYTLKKTKGGEWKWVCPSVVIYLATTVPAIWFLELELMQQRLLANLPRQRVANSTRDVLVLNGKMISISIGNEEWCKILEQILLLFLIVGRWLLPKGEITREQLSQLLLVYIGMAADIIELFEAFKEQTVRENQTLTMIILSLWTASLTQFTLVVTATKAKKTRPALFRAPVEPPPGPKGKKGCCPTEVISILFSVSLQDAPFLVLRMLLIFRYEVLSYTNIFFTCKNTLVLMLQMYRLVVLFTEEPAKPSATRPVVTHPSPSSNSLSYSSESGSDVSGSGSSASEDASKRQRRHLLRRRRSGLTRQVTEDSGRTVSSTVDGLDTTYSLETELNKLSKSSGSRKPPTKSSSISRPVGRATQMDSDSSRSPQRHRARKGDEGVTATATISLEDVSTRGGDAQRRRDKRERQQGRRHQSGNVEKTVKRFEKHSAVTSSPHQTSDTGSNLDDDDVTGDDDGRDGQSDSRTRLKQWADGKGERNGKSEHQHRDRRRERWTLDEERERKGRTRHSQDPGAAGRHGYGRRHNVSKRDWRAPKDLRNALALLSGSGDVRTVVLKPGDDGRMMYVVDDESDIPFQ